MRMRWDQCCTCRARSRWRRCALSRVLQHTHFCAVCSPLPRGPLPHTPPPCLCLAQVANRAKRLGLPSSRLLLMAATRVESILEQMAALRPRAVIVDSIQTVFLDEVSGAAGSVSQVRECATALLHAAKRSGAPVFLVGHVTKSGDIAGPRTLEHIVDVVLYLEGEALREYRLLRGVKNRYGATDEARAARAACSLCSEARAS